MSMRNYAVDDYGLVLNEETIKAVISKLDIEPLDEDTDIMYVLYDEGICEYISEFTGEAQLIDNNGNFSWSNDNEYYDEYEDDWD